MKKNLMIFFGSLFTFLALSIITVVVLDPFFHYHTPLSGFYYTLDSERYQNRGIAKYFEYNAILTGTSLTQNSKTSDIDRLFGTNAIKLPFPGSTFYETAETERIAFESGHNIKLIIRSFDINHLVEKPDATREDLGNYPDYLYNDTIWDDYKYVLNLDIMQKYCLPMLLKKITGKPGGHLSFDDYVYENLKPGNVLADTVNFGLADESIPYTSTEDDVLTRNVEENIISLAKAHPETTFIYFIPPYSISWWNDIAAEGKLDYTCDSVLSAVEKMIGYENIKIYCFANETEITTDLSNYADSIHYVNAIGDELQEEMRADNNRLSKDNYIDIIEDIRMFYKNYDYNSLKH
jgi:hypothetical protein